MKTRPNIRVEGTWGQQEPVCLAADPAPPRMPRSDVRWTLGILYHRLGEQAGRGADSRAAVPGMPPDAGNIFPTLFPCPAKTPPRAAPSWMPPAVGRLRHVLPVTGSSAPGAACRTARRRSRSGLPRFGGCHLFQQSARDRVAGRRAAPTQLTQPPSSVRRSDAGDRHHVRGLGDNGDFGELGGRREWHVAGNGYRVP